MRRVVFLIVTLCAIGCSHKEVVKEEKKVENNRSAGMVEIYEKMISSIKAKDISKIIECYSDDGVIRYLEHKAKRFRMFDGTQEIIGTDNISLQYSYLIKMKYLDDIEYNIISINQDEMYIKFINLWENTDYQVDEIIYFGETSNGLKIIKHTIQKSDKKQ